MNHFFIERKLELSLQSDGERAVERICAPVYALHGTVAILVDFRIHAVIASDGEQVSGCKEGHQAGEADLLKHVARHVIGERYALHSKIAAILHIIRRVMLLKSCLRHICDLSWNTPAAQHVCGLVLAIPLCPCVRRCICRCHSFPAARCSG